jgi:hypothetical protein
MVSPAAAPFPNPFVQADCHWWSLGGVGNYLPRAEMGAVVEAGLIFLKNRLNLW